MKTSSYRIAIQISKRYLFYKQALANCNRFPNGQRFIEFCDSLHKIPKFYSKVEDCILLGSGREYILNAEEAACFGQPLDCKVYDKMIFRGM